MMTETGLPIVFFDLDQTLVYGEGFGEVNARTCQAVARRVPGLSAGRLLDVNEKVWVEFREAHVQDWEIGNLSGRALSEKAWRRTLTECELDDESLVDFASSMNIALINEAYKLFTDARPLIDAISKAGLKTALITNGASDSQRAKLEAVQLEAWFDVLAVSGDNGVVKPDPAIFAAPLAELRTGSEPVWHVGDSLETDVAGAKAAGIGSVWVNRTGVVRRRDDPVPDVEIRSLTELIARLNL